MNIAPFESVEHLIGQLRVNARGEAEESGHPVEEHPSWIAAAEIERLRAEVAWLWTQREGCGHAPHLWVDSTRCRCGKPTREIIQE